MQSNRLGCLTSTGIIAALITLAILAGTAYATGGLMFDPGPLNAQPGAPINGFTSHADFEKDCQQCHTAFWEGDSMDDHCLACHTQIRDGDTLHAEIASSFPELKCRACHPEHRGPDAPLTDFTGPGFPHNTMGFYLSSHAVNFTGEPFTCLDCHTSGAFGDFDQQDCIACHQQGQPAFTVAHTLGFGSDCMACHDGKESLGTSFDHASTAFNLTGNHAELICTQCHLNARTRADFKAAPGDCLDCHAKDEPHGGRFGTDCAACHSTAAWEPAKFDHNLSVFKLAGSHARVACEGCHANGQYQGTPQDCYSCHKQDDEHNGGFGTDCAVCHNPSNWEDVNVDHDTFAFKLTGAHTKAACESCHQKGVFTGTPSFCAACHAQKDAHQGRFGTDCGLCHSTTAWEPATFDHRLARFQLTGAHASVSCEGCHQSGVFTGTSSFCAGCHGEPAYHAGLFGGQSCENCHSTNNWSASYNGPHPGIADEHGSGVNHGGQGCRSCHTENLATATCTACHDSNNPGDGGGDD